ncbi:MAG TPA: AarF/UbiB family protein [Solirubrobacteraceae bacterium]|jgi:predicted unusual protein kinase regulating ubiquinone biosynthesis (AarF/ABC1/UbiB family)|nr:AarF/UbiB family protein [Solirubrobacteraceae bacterium]
MSTQESNLAPAGGAARKTGEPDTSPRGPRSPAPAHVIPRANSARRVLALAGVALVHGLPLLLPRRWRRIPGPVRLRRALETLGGGWIKLGQLLALRFDLLPAAYCVELFNLLNRVAPFPYEEVERIVDDELGLAVGDLYASFEREPFGSASIGQVHDAVLHDGRRVAVKVQRPGIDALLMCDIALMYRISRMVDWTHLLGGTRSREVIDELARWTREELDYRVEAANAATMRAAVRDHDTEYDPEVFPDYTTRRVLTAERLDGLLLVEIIRDLRADREGCTRRLREAGYDLDQAAANVVSNFLSQAYATGIFHGDLHPANLLLLEGNRIGYVDFGIIGRLPEEVHELLGRYAMRLFGGEAEAAIDDFLKWLRPSSGTNVAAARREMTVLTERFLDDLAKATAGRREILARYQIDLLSAARAHRMVIDPAVILYVKVVLTIDAVTSELAPSLDLQSLIERFFSQLIIEGLGEPSE